MRIELRTRRLRLLAAIAAALLAAAGADAAAADDGQRGGNGVGSAHLAGTADAGDDLAAPFALWVGEVDAAANANWSSSNWSTGSDVD
jgi:hypothetical protein